MLLALVALFLLIMALAALVWMAVLLAVGEWAR
jgi:hypothetical protein